MQTFNVFRFKKTSFLAFALLIASAFIFQSCEEENISELTEQAERRGGLTTTINNGPTLVCFNTASLPQGSTDTYSVFENVIQKLQHFADFRTSSVTSSPDDVVEYYYGLYTTSYIPYVTSAPSSYNVQMQADVFAQINEQVSITCGVEHVAFNPMCPTLHPSIVSINFLNGWSACGCPASYINLDAEITLNCL